MEESVLSRWKTKQKNEGIPTGITKIPDNIVVPLSQGQHRLWFLQKLYPENSFYNYSESYVFTGGLKKNNLISSLQHIFKVNSILRSTYHQVDDTTYQKINKGELEVSYFDFLSDTSEQKSKKIDGIIYESASKAFDLSSFPLMRALLIRVDSEKHILCITMHHIITDKWSMGILREQLASNYDLLENNKPLPISLNRLQYEDYAYWQSSNNNFVDQLGYWQKKLSGEIPYLALPVDYQRGETTDFKGSFKVCHLDIGLSKKILATAKNMGCTPYVLLLSVYYVLLYRYTGQQDILIGSPISNRGSKELENIIGFFNETVVLRTLIKPEMSFDDLVESVRNTTLEAFSNKDVPFEMLVKTLNPERSLSINPFFRVMFLYHQVLPTPSFGKELSLAHSVLDLGVAKFDLTLYVSEENGSLSTTFEYATDIFKEETIAQFQKHFETLLHQLISDREQCVSEVNMLTDKENKLFFKLSTEEGGYYSKYRNIHTIITEIGAENNDAVAVVYKNKSITYGELLERSNRYAAAILKVTKGKNEIIGLCVERSIDMIVGILGILKSGCAYLPIDPEYPSERIDFMMRDAKVPMVISQKSVCSVFKNFEGIQLLLEDVLEAVSIPDVWPEILIDATAYVIYTSGSTGEPKGVPISHRNIIASTESRLSFYADQPKAFLLLSSVAFDSSKVGIFWTLCTGGTLVIGEKHIEQDMENLASVIKNNEITHTLMLPTLYNLCLEYCEPANLLSLQTVTVAGEACPTNLVKHHFDKLPQVRLYNEYGPTEATVWCIAHQVTKKDLETSVPIGKAVGHSEVYLLDKNGMLSPYGSVGEIYIGGPGLAGTYLNRPELDKEVYIDNPFIRKADAKLYKTGDLARYNSNGDLEFLGRLDQQLKIRGHRIELEEIEKKIAQQENVSQCVVVVQELNGNKQLLAFVITSDKTYAN